MELKKLEGLIIQSVSPVLCGCQQIEERVCGAMCATDPPLRTSGCQPGALPDEAGRGGTSEADFAPALNSPLV